jgi:tetratricopeptide (TPR) repeat protein
VASNWEWRGREDLPDDYLEELVGARDLPPDELQRRALQILAERLQDRAAPDRYDLLFQRAALAREMGHFAAARANYRDAMNSDPHLRRALDTMGTRVRNVATRHDARFVDAIDRLSSRAEHGIVGFDQFYDYVHFTPEGAVVLAAELYEELQILGILPGSEKGPEGSETGFQPQEYVQRELARIESLRRDDYDVESWLGIGFDRSNLADRNLWKYDEMAVALDDLIEREPDNVAALVYRGNVHYHQIAGATAAAADYRAALELEPDNAAIRANLERLLRDRAPKPFTK